MNEGLAVELHYYQLGTFHSLLCEICKIYVHTYVVVINGLYRIAKDLLDPNQVALILSSICSMKDWRFITTSYMAREGVLKHNRHMVHCFQTNRTFSLLSAQDQFDHCYQQHTVCSQEPLQQYNSNMPLPFQSTPIQLPRNISLMNRS